jgi:hypothetical protein
MGASIVYDLGKSGDREDLFPQFSTVLHRTGGVIHRLGGFFDIFSVNLRFYDHNYRKYTP